MSPSKPRRNSDTQKPRVLANRYEIVRKLGVGNYGTAFLCKDIKCNNQLKVIKQIPVDLQPDESVDAVREARLLSKLDHPGVVKFHDSFVDEQYFCIVTEYCEGGDLDQKIKEYKEEGKSFDETTILDWTVQLLLAAQYIHSRRVLHRDLKTRNIFIRENLLKIGDFGISRVLMGTTDMASTFAGTPYYMSPEVLKHEGYNSKSDVWSIGCIMYELSSLEHAFTGQGLMPIMYKIVEADPPDLPAPYSRELNQVFHKMLIKDPEKRPSAADVLKFPIFARHMAEMKDTLTDEYKAKHNISPETADKEADELASLLRERSHLEDLQQTSETSVQPAACADQKSPEKQLTAKERHRLKKIQDAEKRAKELKKLTRIQLVENVERQKKIRSSLEKPTIPVWKGGNGEGAKLKEALTVKIVSGSQSSKNEGSGLHYESESSDNEDGTELQTVTRRNSEHSASGGHRHRTGPQLVRSFSQKITRTTSPTVPNRMSVTIGGPDDRPIAPMRDKMVYDREHSSLDFEDGIPDDPEEADTFYDQFGDFDDDDDVIIKGSEETMRQNEDLINHLEYALSKGDSEDSTIVADDTIHGAFGPYAREKKINNLKAEILKHMEQKKFEEAYNYLKKARNSNSGRQMSEEKIMVGLRKIVQNPSDCFVIDQIIFLEEQALLS